MKHVVRLVGILIFTVWVALLGMYAYRLATQTLTLPFIGMDDQRGTRLEVVVQKPSFFRSSPRDLLDPEAFLASLMLDGTPLSETKLVSGEYRSLVSGEYALVSVDSLRPGQTLRLDSQKYNTLKSNEFRLPRDLELQGTSDVSSVTYTTVGIPGDRVYQVSMMGMTEYSPRDIRYFAGYDQESCQDLSDISWRDMEPLRTTEIAPPVRDAQIQTMMVKLEYRTEKPDICIIAGVRWQYQILENRHLESFTLTGSSLDLLSPELDMKSQIEFRFSESIFVDSGALYSPTYIAHREAQKIRFLKHLSVLWLDQEPTIDDLVLTPTRAVLTLPLLEKKRYILELKDLQDIYGRIASMSLEVTPEQSSFLSLRFSEDRTIYGSNDPIGVKLYALSAPKTSYEIKLCKLPLESYARLEKILVDPRTTANHDVQEIIDAPTTLGCQKKVLNTPPTGYVAPFSPTDFSPTRTLTPGLYTLAFDSQSDVEAFSGKFIRPLVFSVINTSLTMKVDASGKMFLLATDLDTGNPLPDQEIIVMRNISRTHKEIWNQDTGKTDIEYLPLSTQAFATGVSLGKTQADGTLSVQLKNLPSLDGYDSSPYSLSFENWWMYEGRYDSFLVQSRGSDRLGYLVSTWNDGITGYNFWLKESDYSYWNKSKYTSYLHTDRRLYLPWEKVYIHAIVRENSARLSIPADTLFDVVINDPNGREIQRATQKPNEFGTLALELNLPKSATLGMYTVSISTPQFTEYVENGYTNFQVEVFKNPTFTAEVRLQSPDIKDGYLTNLRKVENTDTSTPWITTLYKSTFQLEGIVKARYYNGAELKNLPFTYRVYRSQHYPDDYFSGCFWGCYYDPPLEFFTEGTGSIDRDGFGLFRTPVDFSSDWADYTYTVEVTLRDPLSSETVTTPGTLLVKLPATYKGIDTTNPLTFVPKKKILLPTESLQGTLKFDYGKWDTSLAGKYRYQIIERTYREVLVDDIRSGKTRITTPVDTPKKSGILTASGFQEKLLGLAPGEYHFRVEPNLPSIEIPSFLQTDAIFYIAGGESSLRDSALRVIPDKTTYLFGETARILFQIPFTGSTLLITYEKGGVVRKEYLTLTGNTLTKELKIDDLAVPNLYIGAVAYARDRKGENRSYAVGYGEVVVDLSAKKSKLTLTPDKAQYKNKELARVDMLLTDRSGTPLQGEVAVMVVDESLIRLLGNIDLDVIPKFFQKFPFTVKTSLSLIGMERNRFLSRKGSNGGGGDKWGGGQEISSRSIFKNTAYYNPSVRTDANGKARIEFPLPDNITDYRIIAIAQTKDSQFSTAEKTIAVRKDFVLEPHIPLIIRKSDRAIASVSVFNATPTAITGEVVSLIAGKTEKKSILLAPKASQTVPLTINHDESYSGSVSYQIELRADGKVLDSIIWSIQVAPLPEIEDSFRTLLLMTGTTLKIDLPKLKEGYDALSSRVSIAMATTYAVFLEDVIESLIQYPYGCIEQTIASTLPNTLALSIAENTGIKLNREKALEYTNLGVEKILRMQHPSGGWVYWEGGSEPDMHITPYVLRSLLAFRELGVKIPEATLEAGRNYLENTTPLSYDPNLLAETAWTLAELQSPVALLRFAEIDPVTLNRHAYLSYAFAAGKLGKLTPDIKTALALKMKHREINTSYWYWDTYTDTALYIRFLQAYGDRNNATQLLLDLISERDYRSYYVSTQEKIQTFLALAEETKLQKKNAERVQSALRSDGLIADMSIEKWSVVTRLDTTREKVGATLNLKRENAKVPLYVIISTKDRTKDITKMPSVVHPNIRVERQFSLVDESRGSDQQGNFVALKPVTDGVFQKGKLYRAEFTVTLANAADSTWYQLALEDHYPMAWRPINGLFKTESSREMATSDQLWYWSYTESRSDRLLVHLDSGVGTERKYRYYFRPEVTGTFLLPPAVASFMYQPETHASTTFERIEVKD